MKPDDFVRALRSACADSAVTGCLDTFEKPLGRAPRAELVRISQWFHTLSLEERELLKSALQQVADATLFGVLCVVDGVRPIEDSPEKSEFTLTASRGGSSAQLSPNETFLHDLFRSEP
jgi:hypothetical protein